MLIYVNIGIVYVINIEISLLNVNKKCELIFFLDILFYIILIIVVYLRKFLMLIFYVGKFLLLIEFRYNICVLYIGVIEYDLVLMWK